MAKRDAMHEQIAIALHERLHRSSPRVSRRPRRAGLAPVLVMAALVIVHLAPVAHSAETAAPAAAGAERAPREQPPSPTDDLPPHVRDMRDAILAAVRSGRIEDLRTAIEWNELPPEFGDPGAGDPIAFLKAASSDGQGKEVLTILDKVLARAPARMPIGRDPENNTVFVWPYLAERPLDKLTQEERADLADLVPPEVFKSMLDKNKWSWWRLAIGADGTWLAFMRHDKP